MERKAQRLEIWSDVQAASGTRLAIVNDWISATDHHGLDGQERATFSVRRETQAWSSVQERRIVRVVFTDDTWEEWRIAGIRQMRDAKGLIATITCESVRYDLANGFVSRTEANGDVNPYFELYGLTPTEHMGVIMGGAPTHFSQGTAGSSGDVDMVYDWDSPLSALSDLADQESLEIEVVQGSTTYTVNLASQIGSTAEKVYFRYSRNLTGVDRDADVQTAMATRIYPRGGGEQGDRLSIGDASWLVASVSSATVTLSSADGYPVAFADQFNSLYVEEPGGTKTQVSDCSTGLTLVLATASHNITAGERIQFRSNSSGAELIYLQDPVNSASTAYGVVQRVLDRPDIPNVNNLISTPFLDTFSAGVPTNWSKIGAPTVAESTAAIYRRYGLKSAHVTASASGQGLQTAVTTVSPSSLSPFFTGQISLLVKSGIVKLEMVDVSSTQSGVYPPAGAELALTSKNNVWVENLAIGGIDLNQVSSTGVRLKVTAYSTGGAEFYLDAGMLTQTAGGVEVFYDGRASNDLFIAGNEYLQLNSVPFVSFDIDVIDLERLYPDTFSERLTLGGTVQVVDSDLGFDFQTRVIELDRDLDRPGASRVKLSNKPEDLTGLGVPQRRGRAIRDQDGPTVRRPVIEVTASTGTSTGATYSMTAKSNGQLVAIYYSGHDSTAAASYTRVPSTGWKESGYQSTATISRPYYGDAEPKIFEAYTLDKRGARSPIVTFGIQKQDNDVLSGIGLWTMGQTTNGAFSGFRLRCQGQIGKLTQSVNLYASWLSVSTGGATPVNNGNQWVDSTGSFDSLVPSTIFGTSYLTFPPGGVDNIASISVQITPNSGTGGSGISGRPLYVGVDNLSDFSNGILGVRTDSSGTGGQIVGDKLEFDEGVRSVTSTASRPKFQLDVPGLSLLASTDIQSTADYIPIYDASTSLHKRMSVASLTALVGGGSVVFSTSDPTGSWSTANTGWWWVYPL